MKCNKEKVGIDVSEIDQELPAGVSINGGIVMDMYVTDKD